MNANDLAVQLDRLANSVDLEVSSLEFSNSKSANGEINQSIVLDEKNGGSCSILTFMDAIVFECF